MHTEHEYEQDNTARLSETLRERFETQASLQELAEYPNFVVWRYALIDGQRKKPPFHPATHRAASPTDRTT